MTGSQPLSHEEALAAGLLAAFRRASSTISETPAGVIATSIAAAEARERQRRRKHLVTIAASAAMVGSIATGAAMVTTMSPTTTGAGVSDAVATAAHFGVPADRMGTTLAQLMLEAGSPGAATHEAWTATNGLPGWASPLEFDLGLEAAADGGGRGPMRAASAALSTEGTMAQVSVSIRQPTDSAAPILTRVINTRDVSSGVTVERVGVGMLILRGPARGRASSGRSTAGAATLVTDDGWVVNATTPDVGSVSMDTLTSVALDDVWLR